MTPTELNILRAQTVAPYAMQHAGYNVIDLIDRVDEVLAALGITADDPAPAEPAPVPDCKTLLKELVEALAYDSTFDSRKCGTNALAAWNAAVQAVRP